MLLLAVGVTGCGGDWVCAVMKVLMIFKMIDVSCDRRLTKLELLKFFTR